MGGATGIRTRKHPDKALTVVGIRALKKPGRYADGNGLSQGLAFGGIRWELRTVVRGKRCDIGLGGLKVVTLAEAREEARKYRAIARDDGDLLAEKRRARRVVPTFRVAAETVRALVSLPSLSGICRRNAFSSLPVARRRACPVRRAAAFFLKLTLSRSKKRQIEPIPIATPRSVVDFVQGQIRLSCDQLQKP